MLHERLITLQHCMERKAGVSADGQDSQPRLPAPCLYPSQGSAAPRGRSVTAPFMTALGSSAAAHAGPAKLVLHTLGKNDSFSFQTAQTIKRGRGFHACPNLPLSKCLHTQHGRAGALRSTPGISVAQLGVQPLQVTVCPQLSGLLAVHPCPAFLPPALSPSSWSIGLTLQTGAKGPKHGKRPALRCPEVKGANCFSWNVLQISHLFPPQMWETSSNPLYKRVFSHVQITHVNAHCAALQCPPQT